MKTKIKFGTDGWRGIIGGDFTFDNVCICAQAVANYLQKTESTEQGLVIGYDTRFASGEFAEATAEVIAGNGIKVSLCSKPTPTPVLSWAVKKAKAAGGIIITASHNPAIWNGFKYKRREGTSASPEIYAAIGEEAAELMSYSKWKRLSLNKAINVGLIEYLEPMPGYKKQVGQLVDLSYLQNSGLKIIVDTMYGAGTGYFPALLQDGKIQVSEINSERNPLFPGIQPEPIAKNLNKLIELVRKQKADIGLANDGDADRIGIIDEKGNFISTQQVFALLALYFLELRGEHGPIVKTVSSTYMINILKELFKVSLHETPVGFPFVAQAMIDTGAIIGGEESGGFAYGVHLPERDGILAGLYFLDFMLRTGKTPSQLIDYLNNIVGPHCYDRLDLTFSAGKHQMILNQLMQSPPPSIANNKIEKIDTTDRGLRFMLTDKSWLLIRFSGTEPLVRLYAEASGLEQTKEILDDGKRILGL